ncbi:MAG TPA: tetratricopeptide repeat protein [Gammaproteobacteria bacterium]|nr:tetratricopeptide repeat protein [Gammaproteobacteria bacterium]
MNDETSGAEKGFAAALAMREAGNSVKAAEHAMRYLDEQLKLQREHAQREAALHDLQAENLKLQSQMLRSQHRQSRSQRTHDRFRTIYQTVLSVIALAVLGVIVYAVYSAATDQSVVVNQFQVPPSFDAAGNNGTVVASDFLDKLQTLQAASRGSQAARVLQDAWSNNIQLQIPQVHVSLGDIQHTLHNWLGHQIEINGEIVMQGKQIALTVRGTGFAAKTFSGALADLQKILTAAAEYVYGQAEPYLFSTYLEQNGRDSEAIVLTKAAFPAAAAKDRPWLLNGWGNALTDMNQYSVAVDKYEEAIRIDPHFWIAYTNLTAIDMVLGREEQAYQSGIRMERIAHRGSWFAAHMPEANYEYVDFLRLDLPALHRELVADEAAHGGEGSNTTQDAPWDAEMLARMHAYKQALQTLQASPGAGSDPYELAEAAFVQGLMALDQQNYAQATSAFQTTNTLLTQNPTLQGNFYAQPDCYLGLTLEFSGQSAQADAAIIKGSSFVDCYRFKGDIADHRGDWAQAQKDYAEAMALTPSLPMAYESWGLALLRHKDYQGAITKFKQANARGPHWCDPLEYWGETLAAEGDYNGAVEKYTEASKYTPSWGALQLHWGEALNKLGRHHEALAHYQSAQGSEDLTAAEQTTLATLLGHTSLPAS